jgi:hypothetical protein
MAEMGCQNKHPQEVQDWLSSDVLFWIFGAALLSVMSRHAKIRINID